MFFTIIFSIAAFLSFSYQPIYGNVMAAQIIADQMEQAQINAARGSIIERIRLLEETIKQKSRSRAHTYHPEEFREDLEKLVANIKKLISLDAYALKRGQEGLLMAAVGLWGLGALGRLGYICCNHVGNDEILTSFMKNASIALGVSVLAAFLFAGINIASIEELDTIVQNDQSWKSITDYTQPTSKIMETIFDQIEQVLRDNSSGLFSSIFAGKLIECARAEMRNIK